MFLNRKRKEAQLCNPKVAHVPLAQWHIGQSNSELHEAHELPKGSHTKTARFKTRNKSHV